MLESTPRSSLYHVYNPRYERSCKTVFGLDFQGHAIKIEFFHYHRWIPWPRKHTHEKYFQKIRTGRQKSRGVVSTPLGVFGWRNTLGICGLISQAIFCCHSRTARNSQKCVGNSSFLDMIGLQNDKLVVSILTLRDPRWRRQMQVFF